MVNEIKDNIYKVEPSLLEMLGRLVSYIRYGNSYIDRIKIFMFCTLPRIIFSPFTLISKKYNKRVYHKLIRFLNFKTRFVVRVDDMVFVCNRVDHFFHVKSDYEIKITKLMTELSIKMKNGFFIDVGAHIGRYSVIVGKKSNLKVVSVEPDPDNFKTLFRNIYVNDLGKKTILLQIAASDKNGTARFFISDDDTGENTLLKNREMTVHRNINITTKRIDTILKEQGINPKNVKLIKIDVEGWEYHVFKGMENLLNNSNAIIVFESWDMFRFSKVSNILRKYGYKIKRIDMQNYIAFKGMNYEE